MFYLMIITIYQYAVWLSDAGLTEIEHTQFAKIQPSGQWRYCRRPQFPLSLKMKEKKCLFFSILRNYFMHVQIYLLIYDCISSLVGF